MADGNGKKDPLQQIVEHLAALRGELKSELREFRGDVNQRFDEVNQRLVKMDVRFEKMELRLDRIVDNTGGHYRRLEERVAALEAKEH